MIKVENITKAFGPKLAVNDVSLRLAPSLLVTDEEIDEAVAILAKVLA